jgi:hypothetical protein
MQVCAYQPTKRVDALAVPRTLGFMSPFPREHRGYQNYLYDEDDNVVERSFTASGRNALDKPEEGERPWKEMIRLHKLVTIEYPRIKSKEHINPQPAVSTCSKP